MDYPVFGLFSFLAAILRFFRANGGPMFSVVYAWPVFKKGIRVFLNVWLFLIDFTISPSEFFSRFLKFAFAF